MKILYCINQNRATILNTQKQKGSDKGIERKNAAQHGYKTNITIYERRLELSCVGFVAKEDSKLETEEKLLQRFLTFSCLGFVEKFKIQIINQFKKKLIMMWENCGVSELDNIIK